MNMFYIIFFTLIGHCLLMTYTFLKYVHRVVIYIDSPEISCISLLKVFINW